MSNLEIAQTFPEAKPILKRLIKEDKERIFKYKQLLENTHDKILQNVKAIAKEEEYMMLAELMLSGIKFHKFIHNGKVRIWDAEERLKTNEQILRFLTSKSQRKNVEDFETKMMKVKEFPMDGLIKFNNQDKALCIFHNEKTPSMKLDRKRNKVHCFGCGKDADVIDVVGNQFNLSFKESVEWLASRI